MGESPPREHKHTPNDLAFVGPLAFEVGTSVHVAPEDEARRDDIMNVFARDERVVSGKLMLECRVKDTDEPFRREIWETLVFRRNRGDWRLIQEHSTRVSSADVPGR